MAANQPWAAWLGGVRHGSRTTTRQAAMNRVDRPFRADIAMILNQKTGERWERRGGSWFKTADKWPAKAPAKETA